MNITYKDIEKANAEIKTLPLGKKEYAEVAERIKAFRKLYPEGALVCDLVSWNDDGMIVVKATALDETGRVLASDYAAELVGSTNINRYNALENACTSAKGRVLGSLALLGGRSVASYEEVASAKLKQEGHKLATSTEKVGLIASANAKGIEVDAILKAVGFDRDKQPEGMTAEQYGKAMKIINEA